MNVDICPADVKPEPVLCHLCLAERRAQKVWRDDSREALICPYHGPVIGIS